MREIQKRFEKHAESPAAFRQIVPLSPAEHAFVNADYTHFYMQPRSNKVIQEERLDLNKVIQELEQESIPGKVHDSLDEMYNTLLTEIQENEVILFMSQTNLGSIPHKIAAHLDQIWS